MKSILISIEHRNKLGTKLYIVKLVNDKNIQYTINVSMYGTSNDYIINKIYMCKKTSDISKTLSIYMTSDTKTKVRIFDKIVKKFSSGSKKKSKFYNNVINHIMNVLQIKTVYKSINISKDKIKHTYIKNKVSKKKEIIEVKELISEIKVEAISDEDEIVIPKTTKIPKNLKIPKKLIL